jgi:hypothetical protein
LWKGWEGCGVSFFACDAPLKLAPQPAQSVFWLKYYGTWQNWEDRGRMFLRKFGNLLHDHVSSHPKRLQGSGWFLC